MDYRRHFLYTYIHYLLNGFEYGGKEGLMTARDQQLLVAISSMMDKKFDALLEVIDRKLKNELAPIKADIALLKKDVAELKEYYAMNLDM